MNDEFERHLRQHPLKGAPKHWRREILSSIKDETSAQSKLLSLLETLIPLLMQRPKLGLGVIWILIGLLNLTAPPNLRSTAHIRKNNAGPHTPAQIAAVERAFFGAGSHSAKRLPSRPKSTNPIPPALGPRSHKNTTTNRIVVEA